MFPALVNCCTIDWFKEWPEEALASVAASFFQVRGFYQSFCVESVSLPVYVKQCVGEKTRLAMQTCCACVQDVSLSTEQLPNLQQGVIACCAAIHQSVECKSRLYLEELRRYNYVSALIILHTALCAHTNEQHPASTTVQAAVGKCLCNVLHVVPTPCSTRPCVLQVTPASYLELLTTFIKLLGEKRKDIGISKQRLEAGLSKLLTTATQVEVMQVINISIEVLFESCCTNFLPLYMWYTGYLQSAVSDTRSCI